MFEIVALLVINVVGRIGKLQVLIRAMAEQEKRMKNSNVPKSSKKPKGSREFSNLASSINYDRQGGERKKGVKLLGI